MSKIKIEVKMMVETEFNDDESTDNTVLECFREDINTATMEKTEDLRSYLITEMTQIYKPSIGEIIDELRAELPIYKEIPIRYDSREKSFQYYTDNKLLIHIARITRQGKISVSFDISPLLFDKIITFYVNEEVNYG